MWSSFKGKGMLFGRPSGNIYDVMGMFRGPRNSMFPECFHVPSWCKRCRLKTFLECSLCNVGMWSETTKWDAPLKPYREHYIVILWPRKTHTQTLWMSHKRNILIWPTGTIWERCLHAVFVTFLCDPIVWFGSIVTFRELLGNVTQGP